METFSFGNQVQFWPVMMGWIIVCCMYIFSWKRQAMIATAGMIIVTVFVIAASQS